MIPTVPLTSGQTFYSPLLLGERAIATAKVGDEFWEGFFVAGFFRQGNIEVSGKMRWCMSSLGRSVTIRLLTWKILWLYEHMTLS